MCLLAGAESNDAADGDGSATGPDNGSLLAIDGFVVTAELARGGMGIVYRAWQRAPEREVALKMLLPFSASSAELRERFQLEARTLSGLEHPAILPIYETGELDGLPWFTMKLAVRGNLAERLGEFAGCWRKIAELIATVADAVQYAHDHGVLHRDLKPGNILFDADDRPFVADFGLAKLVEADSNFTLTRRVLGTPHYLAPEVAANSARHATTASDVFSLGAILHELLTGRPPHVADGLPALLRKIAEEDVAPMRGANRPGGTIAPVPRDLEIITLTCLTRDPARRYSGARELAAELRRFLAGEPIEARPASAFERLVIWCRRKPALAASLAGCVVIALAGLGGVLWQLQETELARTEAVRQAGEAAGQRAMAERSEQVMRENLYAADILGAHRALQQDDLATARMRLEAHRPTPGRPDLRGFEWRHLWSRTQPDSFHTIRVRDRGVSAVVLSPDGSRLATASSEDTLLFDMASFELIGQTRVWGTQSAAFSRDGERLYIGTRAASDVKVWKFDPVPMPPQLLIAQARWPNIALSPDDRMLAVGSGGHTGDETEGLTVLYRADDGTLLHELPESGRHVAFSPDGKYLATGSRHGAVRLWRPDTGELAMVLTNAVRVVSMRFSPDGATLVVCSHRDGAWLYDVATGAQRAVAREHVGPVWDAAFSPDGRTLATGGVDQTLRLWDLKTGRQTGRLLGHSFTVSQVVWTPDGRRLITGGADGTVRFWETTTSVESDSPGPGMVRPEFFSDDGRWLLSLRTDGSLDLLEQATFAIHKEAGPLGWPLRFLPGDQTVAMWRHAPGDSAMIATHSVPDLNVVRMQTLPDTETPLVLPTLSPDGRWLAAGGPAGSLRLIELEADAVGRNLTLYPTNNTGALSLAFSRDSRTLAASFRDSTAIVLLEVDTGEVLHRLHGHPGFVRSLLFSRAGDRLVSADGDRLIKVWDPNAGRELATFTGHRAGNHSLALTSDGRTLASAAGDGSVRLWHLNTGRELLRVDPPESAENVTFAPDDGALFIQGSQNPATSFPTIIWRAPKLPDMDAAIAP